jgi:hypothetical protein
MTEQIWVALIGAAAFLSGTILGYALRGRAKRSAERKEILQAQLDRVYGPIYGLLKDAVAPGEPLGDIDTGDVERIIKITRANRKFLERRLEEIVDYIEEGLWSYGPDGIEERDIDALWQHVERKNNDLKRALGFPHTKRSILDHFKEIKTWWRVYLWKWVERKKRAGRRRRQH